MWPEHVPAVSLFVAAETQWRTAAIGPRLQRTGLDYGAIEVLMRAYKIKRSPEVWNDLRLLEGFALEAMAGVSP